MSKLDLMGEKAKKASYKLSVLNSTAKNHALQKVASRLLERSDEILKANAIDIENAKEKGITGALMDRLTLNSQRIKAMAEGVEQIVSLPDPVGEVVSMWRRPNGLQIGQQRVPIGVIGIIYEARPNVTVDAAALCLDRKSVV